MTDKIARPTFQPAPRPRPINDPATTEALKEATRDLGFGRPSHDAAQTPAPGPEIPALALAPAPAVISPRPDEKTDAMSARPEPQGDERTSSLKLEIDDPLSMALKLEAVRRRVTVKYLVLEALAAKGYPVDLERQPQDGRRLRK